MWWVKPGTHRVGKRANSGTLVFIHILCYLMAWSVHTWLNLGRPVDPAPSETT